MDIDLTVPTRKIWVSGVACNIGMDGFIWWPDDQDYIVDNTKPEWGGIEVANEWSERMENLPDRYFTEEGEQAEPNFIGIPKEDPYYYIPKIYDY